MKKHPYVAVMEAIKESLNGEAMRLFKMKVDSIKKQELLPCPDCGCTDITLMSLDEYEYSVKDSDNSHWAVCDSCKRISISKKTAEEARDAWNEEATKTKMGSDNPSLFFNKRHIEKSIRNSLSIAELKDGLVWVIHDNPWIAIKVINGKLILNKQGE